MNVTFTGEIKPCSDVSMGSDNIARISEIQSYTFLALSINGFKWSHVKMKPTPYYRILTMYKINAA